MEKASYLPYREGLEPHEGGGTPRPDPPGRPGLLSTVQGAIFGGPGLGGGPSVTEQGVLYSYGPGADPGLLARKLLGGPPLW